MNLNELDLSNSEDPAEFVREFSVQTMTNVITAHSDVDETVAVITAWYSLHRQPSVLMSSGRPQPQHGRSDPQAIHHQQKGTRFKKRLIIQRALGEKIDDSDAPALKGHMLSAEFNFPVHNFLKRLASYLDVPLRHVKHTFSEQLEQAYTDLVETGKGKLKDFGVLYRSEGEPTNLVFDIKEELRLALSSDAGAAPDPEDND